MVESFKLGQKQCFEIYIWSNFACHPKIIFWDIWDSECNLVGWKVQVLRSHISKLNTYTYLSVKNTECFWKLCLEDQRILNLQEIRFWKLWRIFIEWHNKLVTWQLRYHWNCTFRFHCHQKLRPKYWRVFQTPYNREPHSVQMMVFLHNFLHWPSDQVVNS